MCHMVIFTAETTIQNRNTGVYESIDEMQMYEIPQVSHFQSEKNKEHIYNILETAPQQLEPEKESP